MSLQKCTHERPRSRFTSIPRFFSIVLLGLLLTACGQNVSTDPGNDIIGTWISNDGIYTLTFTPEGKISSVVQSEGFRNELKSDLIFTDDTHIVGVWEMDIQEWEVRIKGDRMVLKGEDGRKINLRRI